MAKQSELKKIKNQLEERDNDINSLSYDKDGLRQQLKDTSSQMDTLKGKKNIFCQVVTFSIVSLPKHNCNFPAKMGTLESLLQSKDLKINELRNNLDEQKVEMDHKTSNESSLGGQMTALRDEKAKLSKDLLNVNQLKKELENR